MSRPTPSPAEVIHVNWTLRNVGSADAPASRTLVRVFYPGGRPAVFDERGHACHPRRRSGGEDHRLRTAIESKAAVGAARLADANGDMPGDAKFDNDQSPNGFFPVGPPRSTAI